MKRIFILVGALLLAGYCSATHHTPRVTFSYVVDVTGSMSREISFVRQAIYNSTYHLSHFKTLGIDHFILVTFSDPASKNQIYEYSTLHRLHNGTSVMKATGGGDCPEYGFDGLLKAINKSFANSYIFFFSDASAKDSYREAEVINAAKEKNVKIWIIGTGCCSCTTYSPYGRIANSTGGVYYPVKENDLPVILKYVNVNVRCGHMENLKKPPASLDALHRWFSRHSTECPEPSPGPPMVPTFIPPVGGVSAFSVSLFPVMIAVVTSLLSF